MKDRSPSASRLISVIVPVYNAEKYLARCIDSVLAQTHSDLELILVDDGSRDGSPAICDEYAARDSRVRVIHKVNGGVSAARNDGIEASRGEFIAFCDNDDFYAPGMLERLLEMCLENDCGIAQCRCERGTADSLPTPSPQNVRALIVSEIFDSFYTEVTCYIWDKLYRHEIWNGVRFPVGSYTGEDARVVHYLMWAARDSRSGRVAFTREKLYCHYRNPESVTAGGFNVRWADGALDDRLEFARREGLRRLYADTIAQMLYKEGHLVAMNRRYNRDAVSRREFFVTHRALFKKHYREAMGVMEVSAKDKIMMTVRRFAPPVYHLYNWLKFRVVRGDKTILLGEIK